MKQKAIRVAQTAIMLVFGNFLLAFAVSAFVIPHNVIMGGATGIGILFSQVLDVEPAVIVFAINMVMLVLGWIVLGKNFFFSTVVSSILYPLFLALVQRIPGIYQLTENTLLASLLGGGILGFAVGIIMQVGSSSGGLDVLSLVVNKKLHIPVSVSVYTVDFIIMGGQVLFGNIEGLLYGIVLLVAETVLIDRVLVSGSTQLQLMVITEKSEELRWRLLSELEVGVTMLFIETGCICQKQRAALCVIPKRKLHSATKLIQLVDSNAFVTVTQIKEVRGQGFTRDRKPFDKGMCVLPRANLDW